MKTILALTVSLTIAFTASMANAQLRVRLAGHTRFVTDVAFSNDGTRLFSGSRDGSIRMWNPQTGEQIATIDAGGEVKQIALAPNAEVLAAIVEKQPGVLLWEIPSLNQRMLTPSQGAAEVRDLLFTPDRQSLMTILTGASSAGWTPTRLVIWDIATWQERQTLWEEGALTRLAVSSDGRHLAAVGMPGRIPSRGIVLRWDLSKPQAPRKLANEGTNYDALFSPDGLLVAVATRHGGKAPASSPSGVQLIDVGTGKVRTRLDGFNGTIGTMAFSPEATLFAAAATLPGSWGEVPGEFLRVWEIKTGRQVFQEADKHTHSLAFSPKGDQFASAISHPPPAVVFRDTRTFRVESTLDQGDPRWIIGKILFSPDGRMLSVSVCNRPAAVPDSDRELLSVWQLESSSSRKE